MRIFPRAGHRTAAVFLVLAISALVICASLPPATAAVAAQGIDLAGVIAIFLGVRLRKPAYRLPWRLFALAGIAFLTGNIVRQVHASISGVPNPFPSPADGLYYLGYISLITGVVLLARSRRRGRDLPNLVDALIVATGIGLMVWAYVMAPYARDASLPILYRSMNAAYSVFDLVLILAAARVAVSGGARNKSYYLLASAFTMILAADLLTTLSTVKPALAVPAGLAATLCYIFTGAASLHHDMGRLTDRAPTQPVALTRRRLVLLIGALAMAPALVILQVLTSQALDVGTVVIGSFLLSTFVIVRMVLLLRANERRNRLDHVLTRASEALVAATDTPAMHAAALAAAAELGGERVTARLLGVDELANEHLEGFDRERVRSVSETDGGFTVASPLVSKNELRGGLVVSSDRDFDPDVLAAIDSLAAAVSLALESAAVTEELHRQKSERRFRALIENSTDVVAVVDDDAVFTYVSPGIETMLGHEADALLGTRAIALVHPLDEGHALNNFGAAGFRTSEVRVRAADGTWHALEITSNDRRDDPEVSGVVLNARDVTDRRRLEEELRHQALHDTLTGLANRALFADRVSHAVARRSDRADSVAVLFIDLDDFKTVNDSLGHAAGDELLVEVAARLRRCLRSADTPARLGGDEFAILLDDVTEESDIVAVADRILVALRAPFQVQGRQVDMSASIGIAIDPARAASAEVLLRNADVAMYLAKERGRDRYEVFEESIHLLAFQRLELKADMPRALVQREFTLHFQPIMDLAKGTIRSAEALVRWQHPMRGMIPPDVFIGLAEETGLIIPLGRWVMEEACRQLADWRRSCPDMPKFSVSINLSVRQLTQPGLIDEVRTAIADAGLQPSDVTLEITESILMADTDLTQKRLEELKALGVTIAVDDFGSGYSSLGYLQRFPVDVLKIDRSFVEGLASATDNGTLMRAIVDLAQALQATVVAEGIEDRHQLAILRGFGCHAGQGYLFSRPVPAGDLPGVITDPTGPLAGLWHKASV